MKKTTGLFLKGSSSTLVKSFNAVLWMNQEASMDYPWGLIKQPI